MSRRFEVEPKLTWGLPAWWWMWVMSYAFGLAWVSGLGEYFAFPVISDPARAALFFITFTLMGAVFVSMGMIFVQQGREQRKGYTTLWAGEEDRGLDEVDPSTGLIIRVAGLNPLSRPQRKQVRAEARQHALQLQTSRAPYKLPFGWHRPRPR